MRRDSCMGRKSNDAVEQIASMIPPKASRSWEHRVSEEHRDTLKQIKAGYFSGQFGPHKTPAAKAIAAWLQANGIAIIGHQGVQEWLAK